MKRLTFILKSTHACNAECIYCAAAANGNRSTYMDIEVVQSLFSRLRESVQQHGYPRFVRLIWHGGEPLLRSNRFYYRVMETQSQMLSKLDLTVEHAIQTNLLLLNESKTRMLRQLLKKPDGSFSQIGTSIDPLPGIRYLKVGDYQHRWREKIDLLRAAGLGYGAICVVHRKHLNRVAELYAYFAEIHQRDSATVRFNPLYNSGRAKTLNDDIHLTPANWGQFMVDFYKRWSTGGQKMPFRPFHEYDRYHRTGKRLRSCEISGRCTDNHLGVDSDGSVYQCGRAIDENTIRLGHLNVHPLAEMVHHPIRYGLRNRIVYLKETHCRACRWWEYCHGGCPNEALVYFGTIAAKSHWCMGRRIFLDTVYKDPRAVSRCDDAKRLDYRARLL